MKNLLFLFIQSISALLILSFTYGCSKNIDESNFQEYIKERKFYGDENIILIQNIDCRSCVSHNISFINNNFSTDVTTVVLESYNDEIIELLDKRFKIIIERKGHYWKKGINFKYDMYVKLNKSGEIIYQEWLK